MALDFSDPAKWVVHTGIPVLDEHELTNEAGQPEGRVDFKILKQIADNNNRRVMNTGDPAPLIVGHTSDDPQIPEKKVVGYAINYRVAPFKNGRHAIYADFAFRRKYAHAFEDYPRRSVELWLSKRELDPIALLGGTTPERDLGVTIRNSRGQQRRLSRKEVDQAKSQIHFQAIALLGSTPPQRDLGVVLKYSRQSGGNVLYSAASDDCVTVDKSKGTGMQPNRYGMGEDDDNDDLGEEDTGMSEGDLGDGGGAGGFDDDQDNGAGEDPMVAKVLASKPMRDLMDKVNQIFEAVSGGGQGAPPPGGGMGQDDGVGMDDGMGAPPPGAGAGAPPPGPPGGGMGGPPGAGNPDEEAAMFHGAPPVRFEQDEPMDYSSSGFGGATSANVPGTGFGGKGGRAKPFSRNGHAQGGNMNGTRTRGNQPKPVQNGGNDEVRRLRRQVTDMALKLARADAEKAIAQLKTEGVVFGQPGDDAQVIAKNETEETEFLATLDPQSQQWQLGRIRKLYARRDTNPTENGAFGPVSRYARGGPETQVAGGDPNDFDPQTPQEAMEYANAIQRVGPVEAIKFMRANKGKRR